MAEKLLDLDLADLLTSKAGIRVFLADAFETGDAKHIAEALGVVARSKGMTKIAQATGLNREQLYKSLSGSGNPTLETTLAIMKALDLSLTAKPAKKAA